MVDVWSQMFQECTSSCVYNPQICFSVSNDYGLQFTTFTWQFSLVSIACYRRVWDNDTINETNVVRSIIVIMIWMEERNISWKNIHLCSCCASSSKT